MKLITLAILLTVALVAKASWAPAPQHPEVSVWGNHHNSYDDAWDNGHHDGAWTSHGSVNTHGISLNQGSGWDNHHYAAPAYHAYAPAHHDNHHHDAHYIAKTLGAVHKATLPGHIDSVKSFNVAPAAAHHDHHSAPAHYAGYYDHAPAAQHDHHHDSHYVAKTLGAVHTAPLPGHVDSVKSFNVAPAPGTH